MDQLTIAHPRTADTAAASRVHDDLQRIITAGIVAAALLVALHAASQLIDFSVFSLRLRALNADKRDSIFGIASLLAQTGVAGASLWRFRAQANRGKAWLALAALVAALLLLRGLATYSASVLAVPLASVFVLLCWLTWRDPPAARSLLWVALGLMMVSLALHQVGPDADASTASDFTWSYQITGVVKHGCELAGWVLVATAVFAGTRVRQRS